MKTIDVLIEEAEWTIPQFAQRARLTVERAEAIAVGRWTPSPAERKRISAALGVPVEAISWGHTMDPRNKRYRQFGMKENF